MDVVCTSPIGILGTLHLMESAWDKLRERYTEKYLRSARKKMQDNILSAMPPEYHESLEETISRQFGSGSKIPKTKECRYIEYDGTGGIYGMLWRLAEWTNTGLRIELKKIPVLQETIEVCNMLDYDPYRLESGGALYFSEDSAYLLETLRKEGFVHATVIGQTSSDRKRLILYDDTERFLTKP